MRAQRRARGFTLMEALVVVAIIAISAAIAAPAIGDA
jgi:prepilin-type N-terminal cleavage/methylation domain-containing protein